MLLLLLLADETESMKYRRDEALYVCRERRRTQQTIKNIARDIRKREKLIKRLEKTTRQRVYGIKKKSVAKSHTQTPKKK